MASRVVVNGRVVAAAEGNGYPTGAYTPAHRGDPDSAPIHYTQPPSNEFVLDEKYGIRFRVIAAARPTEGWVTTSTILSWIGVTYSKLMELIISGDVDCCVERGSPVRMFRILRRENVMKLRAKGMAKKR